jgi:hypothetical protein
LIQTGKLRKTPPVTKTPSITKILPAEYKNYIFKNYILDERLRLIMVDVFDIIQGVQWFTDPKLWLIGAAVLVVVTLLCIYLKIFRGEKR